MAVNGEDREPGPAPDRGALRSPSQIDVAITYCSGSPGLEKDAPELASLPVPREARPAPGRTAWRCCREKPAALRLALFLLSEKGQAIIAKDGLVPAQRANAHRHP